MPISPWRPRQVRDKPVTSPLICPRRRRLPRLPDTNGLVADLSREFFKPSRHVAVVWNPKTSPWLPRNMIHVGDFPLTSRRLRRNFPMARVTGTFRASRRNGIWALRCLWLLFIWRALAASRWLRLNLLHIIKRSVRPNFVVRCLQCESKKSPLTTCGNFSKTVANFSTKFYLPIDARLQIFILLSATLTKLCHIKHHVRKTSTIGWNARWHFLTFSPNNKELLVQILHNNYLQLWRSFAILSSTTQHAFRSMVDILSTLWWSRLIWHNVVKVAGNWIKICSPA